jgi:chromosome segregation ATPase
VAQASASQVQAQVEEAAELDTLHRELCGQQRDEEQIQTQLSGKKELLVSLADSLEAKLAEQRKQFEEDEQRRAESYEHMSARVKELEELVATAQTDWGAAMQANDTLDVECAALEKRVEGIKSALDQVELVKQLEDLEERLSTLHEALVDERSQTDDLTLVRDELRQRIVSLSDCLPGDEGARARIEAKIHQLEQRIQDASSTPSNASSTPSSSSSASPVAVATATDPLAADRSASAGAIDWEAELATTKSDLLVAQRELHVLRNAPPHRTPSWLTAALLFTLAAVVASHVLLL